MNRLFKMAAVLGAGLAVLASCQKEEVETIKTYHMLRITTDEFVMDERVAAELEAFDWRWTSSDVVGVFPIAPKVNNGMQTFYFCQYGVSNNCALFTGNGWDFDKKEDYLAYYPYNSVNYHNEAHKAIALNYNGQTQYGNGNMDGLKKYDYLYTREMIRSEEYLDFAMAHAGALIKFSFSSMPEDVEVGELSLSILDSQGNHVGQFVTNETLDLSSMDGALKVSNTSRNFIVSLKGHSVAEGIRVSKGQTLTVYAMMAEQNLSGQTITCSLMSASGTILHECTVAGINLEAGHAYAVACE